MIPPVVPVNIKSPGEREIFDALASDATTQDWIVLHSLDTAQHVQRVFGEVDFVILIPGAGVLCLEVKASPRIRCEYGVWYYGNSAPDLRGPFKQASEAMHSVRRHVEKHVVDAGNVIFWSAACFPYTDFNIRSSEWHSWQVIDQRACRAHGYSETIRNVLKNARTYLEEKRVSWLGAPGVSPTPETCERIAQALRPDFEVFESPKSRRSRLQQELKRYTDEQLGALDDMEDNSRTFFTGPAGTGKTVLAIEGARRGAARGHKVLLLCFNKFLGKHLQDQVADLPGVTARTLHKYMLEVSGLTAEETSQFWSSVLPEQAFLALAETGPGYDLLIVDEAQDILRDAYVDVLDASVRGGLSDGQWQLFGDFEKQRIYSTSKQDALEVFCGRYHPARRRLRINCRNTPHIAESARFYGQLDPPYRRILRPDNGIKVEFASYRTAEEQSAKLVKTLTMLYEDGLSNEDIVILSPKAKDACAAGLNAPPWNSRLAPYSYGMCGEIGYTTIYAYKGLESPAIVITDIETVVDEEASQLFYVGITRAVYRLVILAREGVPEELRGILARKLSGAVA